MDKIKRIKVNITIYATASLLIIAGLIYFIIIPQKNSIEVTKAGISDQLIALERTYNQGQSLKKINANLKTVESKLGELEKIYIKKDEAYVFASLLEDLAIKNYITQKINLAPYVKNPSSQYTQGSLQLILTGQYNNLIKYLADIEIIEYYVNIKSMDINNSAVNISNDNYSDKNITMKIEANVYWSDN